MDRSVTSFAFLFTRVYFFLLQNQLRLGWYVSSFLLALAFFGPAPMGSIHYEYNAFHAANYAAFSPIAWCIFFSWVVFTSHLGYKSELFFGWFFLTKHKYSHNFSIFLADTLVNLLSWRGFRVTTKMSYAVYLTQFPIFFYQVGRVRSSLYYDFVITVLVIIGRSKTHYELDMLKLILILPYGISWGFSVF